MLKCKKEILLYMKFSQKLEIKQTQTFTLSHQMKMSIECLQLSTLKLKDYLEKELEENPLVELEMNYNYLSKEVDFNQISKEDLSLQKELFSQLSFKNIKVDEALLETLINLIDDDGYLRKNLDELSKICKRKKEIIEKHLNYIKECEPIGVGAYDLKECLLIQMNQLHFNDFFTKQLIENDLDAIAKNKLNELSKKYNCTIDDIKRAIEIIRTLNPRPAINYMSSSIICVQPDILVYQEDGEIFYKLIDYYAIKIMDNYKPHSNEEKKYILEKKKQGEILIDSLNKRNETLSSIMRVLINYQKDYLLHQGSLVPLRLIDIANELNYHETTISRALKDKYYEFENAVYPLRNLLCKQLHGNSADDVKNRIRRLIQKEDKTRPYSDSEIVQLLQQENIAISRRTVNKYREEMKIGNVQTRRIEYGEKCKETNT